MADEPHHQQPRLQPIPYATPQPRRRGTSPIAWVVLGMLVLSFAARLFLLGTGGPRPTANRVKSASNLRQIGQGLILYTNEYGVYPPDFGTLFIAEDFTPGVFINPASNDTQVIDATRAAMAQTLTKTPGHCSYVFASPSATTRPAIATRIDAYEKFTVTASGANFLFSDGHVQWITNPEANRLISELNAGHNPPRPAGAR